MTRFSTTTTTGRLKLSWMMLLLLVLSCFSSLLYRGGSGGTVWLVQAWSIIRQNRPVLHHTRCKIMTTTHQEGLLLLTTRGGDNHHNNNNNNRPCTMGCVPRTTTTTTTTSLEVSRSKDTPDLDMTTTTTTTDTSSSSTSETWRQRLRNLIPFRRRLRHYYGKERTREELKLGIAGFYDRSSQVWEDVWGEHMHHGYYVPANRTDHVQAQIDLIDQVLKWSMVDNIPKNQGITSIVDVGCGIGGSSRHLARKYPGSTVQGITLSPYQASRAMELSMEQDLEASCSFQVADALDMPFANNSFDLVWSLESGEHMPDKKQFISELFRVCKPGGRIILVTWTHRDLLLNETSLKPSEQRLFQLINRAYYLPQWCSGQDYIYNLQTIGNATDVKREDWSYIIAPFWKAVIRSTLNIRSLVGLLRSGPSTIRGAFAMLLMLRGYEKNLIKFDLLTCTKPNIIMTPTTTTGALAEDEEDKGTTK